MINFLHVEAPLSYEVWSAIQHTEAARPFRTTLHQVFRSPEKDFRTLLETDLAPVPFLQLLEQLVTDNQLPLVTMNAVSERVLVRTNARGQWMDGP